MAPHEIVVNDGHRIRTMRWTPDSESPVAIVHLFHGLGEHGGRYERFARACNEANIVVIAHDHRGHGNNAEMQGHFADSNGWNLLISDALQVQAWVRDNFPAVPIILFGHSMGSYIAQSFAMRHPQSLAMLILSASTFGKRSELRTANLLARLFSLIGRRRRPGMLNELGFGAFNRSFQPTRTEMDWLSRDEQEVDKYLADPLCGGLYTSQLWVDLTRGLLEITSWNAINSIPSKLPILILGGERDPVGGSIGLSRLTRVYRETGHKDVTSKIYDGGRHEMLNEINRDEVTADILDWIEARLVRG